MTDGRGRTSTTVSGQNWLGRNGWLLAAPWLMFLVPTLLAVLTDDSNSIEVKIASTALAVAFAVVYLDGFRRQYRREQAPVDEGPNADSAKGAEKRGGAGLRGRGAYWAGVLDTGLAHFVVLSLLALALLLVAGPGAVGVMVFIVVFAVFHFSWPVVSVVFAIALGVTVVAPLAAGRFSELWFLTLIVAAVGAAATVIRLAESFKFDQAHLRTGLAISDERTRVARDVHDVLGHSVTAMILKVELCQRLLDQVQPDGESSQDRVDECRQQLADLESIGRGALAEIRSTVGGLRATNLADEVTAARTVLADAGVELLVTGDVADTSEGHRPLLAWVVREAVTNVVRHANAEHCHIQLAPGQQGVLIRITDDGVGLGTADEGNGLRGLRERVAASGAALNIESASPNPDAPETSDTAGVSGATVVATSGTRIEVSL